SSAYGAAGSLVLVMLWIYYSAQIVLLGAEFTQVYALRCGAPIEPARGAVRVANRSDRDECLRRQRAARRAASAGQAPGRPVRGAGWSGLLWALGGAALGWLIAVWNR
ncbi:MAG TPA: YhjD/YihY/BrkB family envelope integrity protein, partial [Thermomicrobiales bacterium]|nr:YhjD/YihY/BrkB family envelope integrity protein [Thermomicrobiales bacterium]